METKYKIGQKIVPIFDMDAPGYIPDGYRPTKGGAIYRLIKEAPYFTIVQFFGDDIIVDVYEHAQGNGQGCWGLRPEHVAPFVERKATVKKMVRL